MARAKQAELSLTFTLPNDPNSVSFIDLPQCYSLVNRLFCRQGIQLAIAGMSVIGSLDSKVSIARLPEHWPCINGWEKGYHIWRESQQQVLDVDPGIGGRYRDFKVFMDATHQAAGIAGNLIPNQYALNFGGSESYNWNASEIQIPNDPATGQTTGYNLHVVGPSTPTSKGLISGYAASRARPTNTEPNTVDSTTAESWMREAFDLGEVLEDIQEDLEDENDSPPYVVGVPGTNTAFYPGGSQQGGLLTEAVLFTRAGLGTQTHAGGFTAPCGLLRVVVAAPGDPPTPTDTVLKVDLMPGSYKGVMARGMREVN